MRHFVARVGQPTVFGAALAAGALLLSAGVAGAAQAGQVAGYQRNLSGAQAKVATTFVVPSIVSCPPYFAGEIAGALLFASGGHNGGGVQLLCNLGAPGYLAFAQINGTGTGISQTVTPGDTISVSVSESATATSVKVRDTTRGWSSTTTGTGGTVSSAELGIVGGSCVGTACFPSAQFTDTPFSASSINTQPLTGATHVKFVSSAGVVEVAATALNPAGSAFTAKWKSSCAPDPSGRC